MRTLLLLLCIVLFSWSVDGQIIEECPDPNTIVLSSFCADACVICDIDGYVGVNASTDLGEAPPGFCAGTLHNTQWVGFVAGSEDITLSIDVYDCQFDQNDDGIFEGLQIGVYQTTDCNNFSATFNCDDQVFDNTTGTFSNNQPLTIGGIYFLVLDGAFGDICSFTVNVTEGSTTAPDVDQVVPNIVSEATICQGGILDASVDPPIFGAGAYYWTLDGVPAGTDLSTGIQFPSDLGFYELCVDPYNPCSDGLQGCVMIEVVSPDLQLLDETICEGEVYELGGVEYTDEDVYDVFIDVANGCDQLFELTLSVILTVETYLEEEICIDSFFDVGDESFNQAGDYTVYLTSESTGCDSVVYLDLSIIGTEEITQLYETICAGEVYEIGGDQLTEGGNYFYEFTDEVSCDSLVDLTLTVLPAPEGMVDATICNGDDYMFNGFTFVTQGVYSVNIPLPSGCDSIATLDLRVIDGLTTMLNEQICAGESFTVGPNTYTSTGTYETPLMAANGCDSIVTLQLQVIDPIVQTDPVSICTGDSYTVDGTSYSAAGTYDIPYTLANGCDSTYRLVLSVIAPLTETLNPLICDGQSYSLGGQSFSSTGTYTITTPAPNGCDSVYTLNLTVADVIATSEDIDLCDGGTYTIDNTTLTETGTYQFDFLTAGGCDSLVTINLEIADPIVTDLNESICAGTAYLVGNQSFTTSGNHSVVLPSSESCDSTVNLILTVEPAPVGTTTVSICEDESYTFNNVAYNISGTYTDQLSTTEGCDSIDQLILTVIPHVTHTITPSICTGNAYEIDGASLTEADTYTFTFPSSAGCDSILTVILTVQDTILTTLDITICEGETYTVGNNDYSMSGMYEDAFVTADDCDSLVRLDLTVIPTVYTDLDEQICIGETYEVGPESYSTSGIFVTTIPAVNTACDSVVTLTLTVIEIPDTEIITSICAGGAYVVGGISYTTAGIYTIPLTSVESCDSTVILDLTVTDFYETNLNITLCQGESYMVGDSVYIASGSYSNDFLSQENCDSIVNLQLLVNPLLDTLLTVAICEGEEYVIAGVAYNSTGTHQETIPGLSTGCDSTITLQLTVNPVEETLLNEEICADENFLVGNSSYNATGNYVDTLMTVLGCDSIVRLELTVHPILETFLVENICEGEVYPVGNETYDSSGDFTTILMSAITGCDSIVYLDLTIDELGFTELNQSICAGEDFSIGGVPYNTNGTHQETISSVVTGCDSTIVLHLTVNPVYDLPISGMICEGEAYAVGDSLYTETGIWPTLLTSSLGCDSLVTLDLTVQETLITNLDETICAGDTYMVGTSIYAMSGSYTDTLTSSMNCDSVVNLVLLIRDPIETMLLETICANEIYEVGTDSFSTTGNYTILLNSVSTGCDSTVYLDLTVNTLGFTEITESICDGESYSIAGVPYSTSGTHQETIPSVVTGCDSTIVLSLTVNPVYDITISGMICEGEAYTVGDSLYTETGIWPTLLSSSQGCDSLVTLDLIVKETLYTDLDETICAGETYTVGMSTYSVSGTYVDTLTSNIDCDSVVNLVLLVRDPIETMLLETICANEIYEVGTDSFSTTGSYTVLLSSVNTGCDSTVYLDLTVNELSFTMLDEQICSGESFEIGGVAYDQTGIYQADLLNSEGCDSTVVLDLYVAPCNLNIVSEITDNLCQGQNTGAITFSVLVGTPPYTYNWQGSTTGLSGNGTIAANSTEVTIDNLLADNYVLNLVDSNGVVQLLNLSISEPNVLELSLEVLNYGGGFQLSCAGSSDGSIAAAVVGGTPPYEYAWNNGMTDSDAGDLPAGFYELVVTDANGCSVAENSMLMAPALVVAELETDSPDCSDDELGTISVMAVAGGTEPYLYGLDGGAYSPLSLFTEVPIGMHQVQVQDANGCNWELETEIQAAPELWVDLGEDIELLYGDSIRLEAITSYPVASYQWSGGPINSCDNCINPWIAPKEFSIYSVLVTDENGCTAEDQIRVIVRKNRDVFIPTAFSPDGDSFNDLLMIYGGGQVVNIESFLIFNRWGESVYEGYDFRPGEESRGWDGSHRGQPMSAGVYVYVAEITFLDGETQVFKGEVMLMR